MDYLGLSRNREELDRYLDSIRGTSPRSHAELFPDRNHELAYWINAYNAQVVAGVLDRGPEDKSVWSGGLISGYRFFVRRKVVLGGESVSLKKLEDDWIRAGYGDPRIHAALNCASRSCPRLPREPFVGRRLDDQLDAAMREFVADPRNVRLRDDGRVELSKIFDWFTSDFLAEAPDLVAYVNRYRPSEALLPEDAEVVFLEYDKGINAQ